MKQDAFNLQDVPDEPTTLEDDLLEDSNRVYHHDMAKYQLEQQEQWHAVELATGDWAKMELQKPGCDAQRIDFVCGEHLLKTRKQLHTETVQYMGCARLKEEARNKAILLFLATRDMPRV